MQQRGAGKEQDSIRQQLFGKVFRQASGENDCWGTHENTCKVEDPDCRLTLVFEGYRYRDDGAERDILRHIRGFIGARPKTIEYCQYSNFQVGECNQDSPGVVFEFLRFRTFDLEICWGTCLQRLKVTKLRTS